MKQLTAPPCHWSLCAWFGRPMRLINEGDTFWMFACECGCTRAISKPSVRARTSREKCDRDIADLRRRQRLMESRREYSLPSITGVRR